LLQDWLGLLVAQVHSLLELTVGNLRLAVLLNQGNLLGVAVEARSRSANLLLDLLRYLKS
jgi:hypothetical protein